MKVFLFSGHMVDAPGREHPRFPGALEGAVREAISGKLDQHGAGPGDLGVGSAACGSDLLFAEGLLQRGADLRLCLAFPEPEFLMKSVAFAGETWVDRFHEVTARAQVDVFPADSPLSLSTSDPYERTNLWMLETARQLCDHDIVFLCIWDGQGGDGPGGTAHMVETVNAVGGTVERIDPKSL
jgi:hypothetical protein